MHEPAGVEKLPSEHVIAMGPLALLYPIWHAGMHTDPEGVGDTHVETA